VHPILAHPRWLGLYVAGWLPIGVLLTVALGQDARWAPAAVLLVPLTLVHAFIGLSSWYVCRSFPIERGLATWRAALTHVLAATATSGLWVAVGGVWAAAVETFPGGAGAARLYTEQRALLTVVGGLLFLMAAGVHYLLIAFEDAQTAEQRAVELELLARNAELKALRTQIDPHFLFNSLHSISALTTADPPVARRMCVLLADFLRDTLRYGSRRAIPLSDELSLVSRYLDIEEVRLGSRLQVATVADSSATECTAAAAGRERRRPWGGASAGRRCGTGRSGGRGSVATNHGGEPVRPGATTEHGRRFRSAAAPATARDGVRG
jgi:hypothetical protein